MAKKEFEISILKRVEAENEKEVMDMMCEADFQIELVHCAEITELKGGENNG